MNARWVVRLGMVPVLAAGAAALAWACGDDDDGGGGGGSALIGPADGDKLAHQAVLTEKDLPGSGWTVTKTDKFDSSAPPGDSAACKDIDAREKQAKAKSEPARTGRAEKEFSRQGKSDIPLSVEVEVNVFKETSTPSDVLKLFQDALKSGNFETCLKDAIVTAAPKGTKVDAKSGAALASAPGGGAAVAYDVTFAIQGQNYALRYETYIWRHASTGITVTVGGAKDEVTADVVKAAITKTESNLDSLAKK